MMSYSLAGRIMKRVTPKNSPFGGGHKHGRCFPLTSARFAEQPRHASSGTNRVLQQFRV
jgi:hypothetical protein